MVVSNFELEHRADWTRAADRLAAGLVQVCDAIFIEYLYSVVYEREGVATALDTTNRRVRVTLRPNDGSSGGEVACYYGRPSWAASQIVGRRVRVWERVDRRGEPEGPVVVARVYTVDDVLRSSA